MSAMSQFHILQVAASLKGGSASHMLDLSRGLLERGHRVSIASPCDIPELVSEFETLNIPYFEFPVSSRMFWKSIIPLQRIFSRPEFTHIHVHGIRTAFLARLACLTLWKRPPLLYSVHAYHPAHYPNPIVRMAVGMFEQILSPLTDAFICVSQSTREEFLQAVSWARKRCHVVENGIEVRSLSNERKQELRNQLRAQLNIPEDRFVIGCAARLHWQKQIDRLIEAFSLLAPDDERLVLVLIGDGPDREQLERQTRELGLSDRALFLGRRDNIRDLYTIMDLFVLSSLWEGLPLVILEAWDTGIPTVAANVPGSNDLIEDGQTGFLAENTTKGIKKTIQRAIAAKETWPQMIQTTREKLLQHYTRDRMVDRIVEIYQTTSV